VNFMVPASLGGHRLRGWVRSFRETWGFLNSLEFEGDLFVGLKANPHLLGLVQDEEVEFEISNDRGKREAVQVHSLGLPNPEGLGIAPQAADISNVACVAPGRALRAQVEHLVGQQVEGLIKSFKENWGFVNSLSFVGDLFLHSRSNPQLGVANVGDPLLFEIAEDLNAAGGYHAINAVVLKTDVQQLVGETVQGRVKSFRSGWGFVNSSRFEGDVFVGVKANKHLEPLGLQPNELVQFELAADDTQSGIHAIRVQRLGQVPTPLSQSVLLPRPVAMPALGTVAMQSVL